MNPGLINHAPAFFASSCPCVSHSLLPHSRDRRTRPCFLITRSREDTRRTCWVHPPAAPRDARTRHSKTAYARIRGDAPRLLPRASAAVGMGLGRESRPETRRRGGMSKNSAPLRLCGRNNLMHREAPNPRVSRRNPLELQPCESRLAACQHAFVADGHEPRLEHPRPRLLRVFVSSCEPFPASSLTGSPNEALFWITRSREDTRKSCRVHPPAVPREARTGHSGAACARIRVRGHGLTRGGVGGSLGFTI